MAEAAEIWRRLKAIPYPGYSRDIVSFGLVRSVDVTDDGNATVVLAIGHLDDTTTGAITEAVRGAIAEVGAQPRLRIVRPEEQRPRMRRSPSIEAHAIPRGSIGRIVAVAGGKGGVGKSTVAANIAVALAAMGVRTGILDADAYGPNIPRMLGVSGRLVSENGRIRPAEALGVRAVSVALMLDDEQPLIWRGPVTHKLIRQLVVDVEWGDVEILVVDLPPGTGDIPLSIAQDLQPDGAIIVATPQLVAVDDARRAAVMLQRLHIPLIGAVENMSGFVCECGREHELFGRGGVRALAESAKMPFLGEIPIDVRVREGADGGRPVALDESSAAGAALRAIARSVAAALRGAPAATA